MYGGPETEILCPHGHTPMSYWEIYRADLDPLARHYPARPHDIGVHL
ncbi:GNAT family N-acetyltransferase, partial [Streptomyces nigra]